MNIYLDVDAVVCDFSGGLVKKFPDFKNHDPLEYDLPSYINLDELYKDPTFWLALPVLDRPTVKIAGYMSHRPFATYITEFWLYINKFPPTKVYHTKTSCQKAELLLSCNCDLYVDDKPQTFYECTEVGLNTYLYTQPWNLHIKTDKRINNLKELENLCVN
jgi:hypothetical protein